MDRFIISAMGKPINYFPQYLASELGYFKDVDLDVQVSEPGTWSQAMDDLAKGQVHAAINGIWLPALYRNRIYDFYGFAQTSARCPMVLVSREPVDDFSWQMLLDRVVPIVVGKGLSGLPGYLFLAGAFKRSSHDYNRVRFIHDLEAEMAIRLFTSGMGEYIAADPVTAASLIHKGLGYHAANLAEIGERIPWSVYFTTSDRLNQEDGKMNRFTLALHRAMDWIRENDLSQVEETIRNQYSMYPFNHVMKSLQLYKACGMWESAGIDASALASWEETMKNEGIIDRVYAFTELIDPRPHEFVSQFVSR
ncbi:ABC transporter substrate-binding protein [Paenibacillus sp. sgz302251]|uniref:ABC transporter substrate-binding protein n=1 Tax=Paenibacillus sp. sgz302251 TaxID=3414493 RepID=UPI003C7C2449